MSGAWLTPARAAALGALQGPLELLPVSSSGHLILVPTLLGWPYEELDPAARKGFEVALHLGTAAGLGVALRAEVADAVRCAGWRDVLAAGLALGPPAAVGALAGDAIERRFSTPRAVAIAQVVAGAALVVADARPVRRQSGGALDHLAAGLGQAAALVPGVSRGGGVLTAARLRGLDRPAAASLARRVAGPVILAAATRELVRLAGRGFDREHAPAFAAGAAAAFTSSTALGRTTFAIDGMASWRGFGLYRVALGLGALARLRRSVAATAPPSTPPA